MDNYEIFDKIQRARHQATELPPDTADSAPVVEGGQECVFAARMATCEQDPSGTSNCPDCSRPTPNSELTQNWGIRCNECLRRFPVDYKIANAVKRQILLQRATGSTPCIQCNRPIKNATILCNPGMLRSGLCMLCEQNRRRSEGW